MKRATLLSMMLPMLVAACAQAPLRPGTVVGDYQGLLPCADCPGIQMQLQLAPDHRYRSQDRYLERSPQPMLEQGQWSLDAAAMRVDLHPDGAPDVVRHLRVLPDALRLLDADGNDIPTSLNLTLQRTR